MDRIALASVEEFVAACAARQIGAVAMRVVDEVRPRRRDDGSVAVGPLKFVELFAYHQGTVLAARLDDVAPATIQARLVSAGLQVRRRSGNLG